MARPTSFKPETAEAICARIATSRLGLEEVLAELRNAPSQSSVYRWLDAEPAFREKYSRAREFQADYMADLVVKEAFTPRIGKIQKKTPRGPEVTVSDNVERSRLIVSALLKRAAQLAPKKYSDKLDLNHGGTVGVAISDARNDLTAKLDQLEVIAASQS